MNRFMTSVIAVAVISLAVVCAQEPVVQEATGGSGLPRVLILGDSISMDYTPAVQRELEGVAMVYRPMLSAGRAENCEGTTKGVEEVERWLAAGGVQWDVIHFNFGLHDLKRVDPDTRANSDNPAHPRQAEPEVYERQLRTVVKALKLTGARLVFATTTPVPEGGVRPHRDVQDPGLYNRIAVRVMRENGIRVNDLYKLVRDSGGGWQRPVNVHFTAEGSEKLGQAVAREVRGLLATLE